MMPVPAENVQISIALLVILIGVIVLLIYTLRKFMRSTSREVPTDDWTGRDADVENPSAFMTASMQGVIEKAAGAGKRTGAAAFAGAGTRAGIGAADRRSNAQHADRVAADQRERGHHSTNPAAEDALGYPHVCVTDRIKKFWALIPT